MMVSGLGTTLKMNEDIYENVANEVLKHLYEAEEYWKNKR
jgi:hypothetical protein